MRHRFRPTGLLIIAGFGLLCACGPAPVPQTANDPLMERNRQTHAFNARLAGQKTEYRDPNDLQVVMGNVSRNLAMPGVTVNSLLQGDLRGAGISGYRFVINSTLGMAGMADVATIFDTPKHDTDFGETLHVWGVGEGPYLVLPVVGPTTQRDAAGKVVDLFTNPLSRSLDGWQSHVGKVTGYLSRRGVQPKYAPDLPEPEGGDAYLRQRETFLRLRRAELHD